MKQIFAPWRIKYIESPKFEGCIFCKFKNEEDEKRLILFRGEKCFVIMNNYPYNPGHVMIAPYEHKAKLYELNDAEKLEMMKLAEKMIRVIEFTMKPDGFNLGINLGKVAGAGIEDHIHLHIVPRWNGDTNFMPVLADVKVIPEAIEDTYKKLRNALMNKADDTV